MGLSTHVVLLRDGSSPDHQRKVSAMEALLAANVSPPAELLHYFGISDPGEFKADTSGLEAGSDYTRGIACISKWRDKGREGFEVDVNSLPPGVVKVRFYNAW